MKASIKCSQCGRECSRAFDLIWIDGRTLPVCKSECAPIRR